MRLLTELGPRLGFAVTIIPEVEVDEGDVNSTRIRQCLADGRAGARRAHARPPLHGARPGGARRRARPRHRLSDREPRPRERGAAGGGRLRGQPAPARRRRSAGGGRCCAPSPTWAPSDLRRARGCARRRTRSTGAATSTGVASRSPSRCACARSAASRASTRCGARSRPTSTRRAGAWASDSGERAGRRRAVLRSRPAGVARLRGDRGGDRLRRCAASDLARGRRGVPARGPADAVPRRVACRPTSRVIWLRGLRWRQLTNAIRPLPRLALCRATAIGFLANNVLPLRIGEVIRSFVLAREHRSRLPPSSARW